MATMNVSLPDRMKDWVERQAASGRYADAASDYIRDLIRRDEERQTAIAEIEHEAEIGLASGVSELTPEQVFRAGSGVGKAGTGAAGWRIERRGRRTRTSQGWLSTAC